MLLTQSTDLHHSNDLLGSAGQFLAPQSTMLPYSPSPFFGVLAMAFIIRAAAQAVYAPVIISCILPSDIAKLTPSPYSVPAAALDGGLDATACAVSPLHMWLL